MKRLALLVKAWPAALSAILLALATWPTNLVLLVFVGLVPWFWSLRQEESNWKLSSIVFSLIFFGFHMAWLVPFASRWTGSPALAFIPYALSVLAHTPFIFLLGFLIVRANRRGWHWAVPFLWAGMEFIRATLPYLAFPHAFLATPLAPVPQVIQGASLGTVFLVSAWVALVNVVLVDVFGNFERKHVRQTVALAGFAVGLGLFSFARYADQPKGAPKVITLGQLGTDMAFGDRATEARRVSEAVTELMNDAEVQDSEMLILPEGLGNAGADAKNPMVPFPQPTMPVLFGLQREAGSTIRQSAFGWDGSWHHVDKTKLVIFGEYVPFREQLRSFNLPSVDMQPGDKIETMTLSGLKIGPLICFEGLFYEVAQKQAQNGARLLAVISIDDWYMDSGMPQELWDSAVFRAVENGLPLVRAASLGYTGWIDARGNMRAILPLRERRTLRAEVPIPSGSDAFPYRSWFPWLCLAVGLGVALGRAKPEGTVKA